MRSSTELHSFSSHCGENTNEYGWMNRVIFWSLASASNAARWKGLQLCTSERWLINARSMCDSWAVRLQPIITKAARMNCQHLPHRYEVLDILKRVLWDMTRGTCIARHTKCTCTWSWLALHRENSRDDRGVTRGFRTCTAWSWWCRGDGSASTGLSHCPRTRQCSRSRTAVIIRTPWLITDTS